MRQSIFEKMLNNIDRSNSTIDNPVIEMSYRNYEAAFYFYNNKLICEDFGRTINGKFEEMQPTPEQLATGRKLLEEEKKRLELEAKEEFSQPVDHYEEYGLKVSDFL